MKMKKIKHKLSTFEKQISELSLENRLFTYILIAAICVSLILVTENFIISYPMDANIKWLITIVMSIIFLHFTLKGKYIKFMQILFFMIIVLLLLPLGWLNSSIHNPFTIAYSFLICVVISYFFNGKLQIFFLTLEILVIMLMLVLTHTNPELFPPVDRNLQLFDSLIQIPITFFVTILIIRSFVSAYKETVVKLNDQNESLTYVTLHDDLTGIYNRRYIFKQLKLLKKSLNSNHHILIGMVDLDNFKHINDTYGHESGDELLQKAANSIKDLLDDKSFVGRYGGDEFIIVINHVHSSDYGHLLSDLSKLSTQLSTQEYSTSFSGGFVLYDGSTSVDDALAVADKLLYLSKSKGRNQLHIVDNLDHKARPIVIQ